MVDREARRLAAVLVRQLGAGTISNDQFEAEWPRSPGDRALAAIAALLRHGYSSHRTHRLVGPRALGEAGERIVERCARFLESDLEYEWPRARIHGNGIRGSTLLLSLGLLLPVHLMRKRRYAEQLAAGDLEVWPFIRRTDAERTVAEPPRS